MGLNADDTVKAVFCLVGKVCGAACAASRKVWRLYPCVRLWLPIRGRRSTTCTPVLSIRSLVENPPCSPCFDATQAHPVGRIVLMARNLMAREEFDKLGFSTDEDYERIRKGAVVQEGDKEG